METQGHDLVFAIGDVHGHADLLRKLHQSIGKRLDASPGTRALLVHLGDLIDRGPDSRAAVEAARTGGADRAGLDRVTLRGNHEDMMLGALFPGEGRHSSQVRTNLNNWIRNGGSEALASWGFSMADHYHLDAEAFAAKAAAAIPRDQSEFLRALPFRLEADGFAFVHAGFVPGAAPARQQELACMWIRDEFLDVDYDFGSLVVHGHTITTTGPEITGNRLNIDTGAFFTGVLTCAVLTPGSREADFIVAAHHRPERLFVDPDGAAGAQWCRWAAAVCLADPRAKIHLAAPRDSLLHQALAGTTRNLHLCKGDEWKGFQVSRFGPERSGIHAVPKPLRLIPYVDMDAVEDARSPVPGPV